jgi:hypothetical protein
MIYYDDDITLLNGIFPLIGPNITSAKRHEFTKQKQKLISNFTQHCSNYYSKGGKIG